MHLNKNSSNFYVSWCSASELLCAIKGKPSESPHVTQRCQMPWSRWSSYSVHMCCKACHQNDLRQLRVFFFVQQTGVWGQCLETVARTAFPFIDQMELFQEKQEEQLGAVCPSLAFELFTWGDKALKIAISCRLSHHSAPNSFAFRLP